MGLGVSNICLQLSKQSLRQLVDRIGKRLVWEGSLFAGKNKLLVCSKGSGVLTWLHTSSFVYGGSASCVGSRAVCAAGVGA